MALLEKPQVRVFFGLLALGLAYVFISWAIDSGSLLDYAIAILLAISGGRELLDAFRIYRKGQGRRR
ncbi:MAG TPA: hypothetical protein VD735_01995 [Candidatus Saccharimonadales bacterium]|nr:hypothetical protein [Candidatus Saccharimonadales bacterium]